MFCEVNSKCGGDGDGLVVVVTMTVTVTVVVTVTVTLTVVVAGFYKSMLLVDQAAAVVVVKNNFEVPNALQHWQSRLIERRRKIFLKGRSCWIT